MLYYFFRGIFLRISYLVVCLVFFNVYFIKRFFSFRIEDLEESIHDTRDELQDKTKVDNSIFSL